MIDDGPRMLTPDQLIEIEKACDAFELALANGDSIEVEQIVAKASRGIRESLRIELERGRRVSEEKSLSQTRVADGQTVSPDDFVIQSDRVVEFSSSDHGMEAMPTAEERVFGRFRLHSVVGRGSSGVVWRAFDGNLDRWVALKIAHVHSVADAKRFVREAQAAAKLKHPNIIPVFEAGEKDGRCFLVSEFCEGLPLSQRIAGRLLCTKQAVEILLAVCDAVSHSHQHGIVHRDIKPHNIMIDQDGVPLVTDFGLAKNLVQDDTLTLDGELLGTPGYMAPEQAQGGAQNCDQRTDVYSIGVVLFQLLTGQLPFAGGFERIVYQVINSVPPSVRSINQSVPVQLELVCSKCLEKNPDRRYQSVDGLKSDLQRYLDGNRVEAQKVTLYGRYVRWLQRDPRVAFIASACALLLLTVAIGSSVSAYMLAAAWNREKQEVASKNDSLAEALEARQEADAARKRAEEAQATANQNSQLAQQLARANQYEASFLANVFVPVDLLGVNQMRAAKGDRRRQLSVEEIESSSLQADQLLAEVPVVHSRVKGMLANAWRSHGRLDLAESVLQESTDLLERCLESDGATSPNDHAMNRLYWAYLFHQRENFSESEGNYREAIELFKEVVADNAASKTCELRLAQAEFGLGALLLRQKKRVEAREFIERALAKRRLLLAKGDSILLATELAYLQCDPENSFNQLPAALRSVEDDVAQQAMTLYWSTVAYRKARNFDVAIEQYESLIELAKDNIGEDNWLHILALGDLAGLHREAGNYREAYACAKESISRSKEFTPWHPQRMRAMMLVGFELKLAGRYEEAKLSLLEVADHESKKWSDSSALHSDLAWCHFHLKEFDRALQRSELPLRDTSLYTAPETAWYQFTHATMLAASGQNKEAKKLFAKAKDLSVGLSQSSKLPAHSTWLRRVATILASAEYFDDAEVVFRKAVDQATKEYFVEHPRVATIKMLLAENLIRQQRLQEAKPILVEALNVYERCLPEVDMRLQKLQMLLAELD